MILLIEAAHGTVTRHFREYQKGNTTSTNPIASIFAWSKGLIYRAKFDQNNELDQFAKKLEKSCISCVEDGFMTKDLSILTNNSENYQTTDQFLDKIELKLKKIL